MKAPYQKQQRRVEVESKNKELQKKIVNVLAKQEAI